MGGRKFAVVIAKFFSVKVKLLGANGRLFLCRYLFVYIKNYTGKKIKLSVS